MDYKKIIERFKLYKTKEDFGKLSVEMHKKYRGKLEVRSKVSIKNARDLSIAYSPGVAQPCLEIAKNPELARDFVINGSTIAIITDGSAVLGLGDIGPKAALPVMEGKALLFKEFGGLNAFPLALDTKDVDKFVETVKMLAPSFAGINLEDISGPRCFEIEEKLKAELNIPVFHDDQHGTAIVVLAGLINSLKIVNKNKESVKIVLSGAGAAGIAIAKLLHLYGFENIILSDSKGVISRHRTDMNSEKLKLLTFTNPQDISGTLLDALKGADIFIGISKPNLLTSKDIKVMNKDAIIFGLANPVPEIMPDLAKAGGAKIVATGRSDFPNQINNVLVFPGIFKGALESKAKQITDEMKLEAAIALASMVKNPSADKIIPGPFEKGIADTIANAVKKIEKKKSRVITIKRN